MWKLRLRAQIGLVRNSRVDIALICQSSLRLVKVAFKKPKMNILISHMYIYVYICAFLDSLNSDVFTIIYPPQKNPTNQLNEKQNPSQKSLSSGQEKSASRKVNSSTARSLSLAVGSKWTRYSRFFAQFILSTWKKSAKVVMENSQKVRGLTGNPTEWVGVSRSSIQIIS